MDSLFISRPAYQAGYRTGSEAGSTGTPGNQRRYRPRVEAKPGDPRVVLVVGVLLGPGACGPEAGLARSCAARIIPARFPPSGPLILGWAVHAESLGRAPA